jgi:hypothetical protein
MKIKTLLESLNGVDENMEVRFIIKQGHKESTADKTDIHINYGEDGTKTVDICVQIKPFVSRVLNTIKDGVKAVKDKKNGGNS